MKRSTDCQGFFGHSGRRSWRGNIQKHCSRFLVLLGCGASSISSSFDFELPSNERVSLARSRAANGTSMAGATSKYAKKRLEILKSAAAAFRRRGYYASSVASIARALHMTKGNLYYYFR